MKEPKLFARMTTNCCKSLLENSTRTPPTQLRFANNPACRYVAHGFLSSPEKPNSANLETRKAWLPAVINVKRFCVLTNASEILEQTGKPSNQVMRGDSRQQLRNLHSGAQRCVLPEATFVVRGSLRPLDFQRQPF